MNKIDKILSSIDILGECPKLNFNGKKKVTNSFTKIFSLILISLTILIIIVLTSNFFDKTNAHVSQTFQYNSIMNYNFSTRENLLMMKIDENGKFNNNFKIIYQYIFLNLGTNEHKIINEIEFEPCTYDHLKFYQEKEKVLFEKLKKLKIEEYQCFPLNFTSFFITNIVDNIQDMRYFSSISVYAPINLSNSIVYGLNIVYDELDLNLKNKILLERKLKHSIFPLNLNSVTQFEPFFRSNIICEDKGIISKKENYYNFISTDFYNIQTIEKNKSFIHNKKYGKPIFIDTLVIGSKENKIYIRYTKFQEIFAQIFSIYNFLYYISLFLCNLTTKIKIKLFLINKFYEINDIEGDKDKIELANNKKSSLTLKLEENSMLKNKKMNEKKSKIILDYKKFREKLLNPIKNKMLTSWSFIHYYIFKKTKTNKEFKIIKDKFDYIEKKIDLAYILQKIDEIDKIKIVLFNKYELRMLKLLPKKNIFFDDQNKIQKYYSILENDLNKKEFDECINKKCKINKKLLKLINY